ncbi:hypothetical protein QCM77_43295 [Bradyrhizobium sp. SSUT18]|uniref:hypothetical protein n=1 Tax=Bradyrhizobium sp. SSUT18 TaxID=3040602 RepID=UPI00244AB0CB|nr:hypothetical protein [Bradyrhizobium sp. SSUT18]MDH2406625.1 hypothetical protein [Bradyrhizobium sp. SSUT18]
MMKRPRVEALNGTSDRSSVNETKPALFSAIGNERFAVDADTERFVMMTARPVARRAQFDATQRTFLLVQRRDKIVTTTAVSRRDDFPRL